MNRKQRQKWGRKRVSQVEERKRLLENNITFVNDNLKKERTARERQDLSSSEKAAITKRIKVCEDSKMLAEVNLEQFKREVRFPLSKLTSFRY